MHTNITVAYTLDTTTDPDRPILRAVTTFDHDTTTKLTHTVVHELQVTGPATVVLRELRPDCTQEPHNVPMAPLMPYLLDATVEPCMLLAEFAGDFKRAVENLSELAVADFIVESMAAHHNTHRKKRATL